MPFLSMLAGLLAGLEVRVGPEELLLLAPSWGCVGALLVYLLQAFAA